VSLTNKQKITAVDCDLLLTCTKLIDVDGGLSRVRTLPCGFVTRWVVEGQDPALWVCYSVRCTG